MVSKLDTVRHPNPHAFKGPEKPIRLRDTGKGRNRAILKHFNRNRFATFIYASRDRPDNESRNRESRQRRFRFLHDRSISALQGLFGFAPPPVWKQALAGSPFGRIDRHKVHIPEEPAVLESVIEDEKVSQVLLFSNETRRIAIRPNDNRHPVRASRDEERFVSRRIPRNHRTVPRADHNNPRASPLVAPREHDGAEPFLPESVGKQDDEGGLGGSANRQVAHADDGVVQAVG